MITIIETHESSVKVLLDGELTIYMAENLNKEIEKLIEKYSHIYIDMHAVTELDTSCYQIFLRLNAIFRHNNKTLSLHSLSESSRLVFQLYGEDVFNIEANVSPDALLRESANE